MSVGKRTEVEEYATIMHGAMAFAYGLMLRYHIRRKRKAYIVISGVGLTFHTWSVYKHLKEPDTE